MLTPTPFGLMPPPALCNQVSPQWYVTSFHTQSPLAKPPFPAGGVTRKGTLGKHVLSTRPPFAPSLAGCSKSLDPGGGDQRQGSGWGPLKQWQPKGVWLRNWSTRCHGHTIRSAPGRSTGHISESRGHLSPPRAASRGVGRHPPCPAAFPRTLGIFFPFLFVWKLDATLKYEEAEVTHFQRFSEKFANSN